MALIFKYIISYIFNFPKITSTGKNIILDLDHFTSEPFNFAYGIVGKARWAHLSTSHNHIKLEPLAHLAVPTMQYTFSRTNTYLKRQNQTVQLSV